MNGTVTRPWLSARAAAQHIGTSIYNLKTLALAGRIRTKADPGVAVKFNANDVEAIRAERSETADAASAGA